MNMPTMSMVPHTRGPEEDLETLRERVAELEREREQLVAVIDMLQGISSSLHFEEILQTIARKLGETYGLDRSSIYLAADNQEVRLMATYEDPTIRNLIVDLESYPELKQAFESGKTVFIPDAVSDPRFSSVREKFTSRNVGSIIVAPIRWQGNTIGAIFLRTERAASPFSDSDVHFCQVIASLTANALRNAHRFELLRNARADTARASRSAERERVMLLALVRRLLDGYIAGREHRVAETLLPHDDRGGIDRVADEAMKLLGLETADAL
ncbi:MAG TPA: GAF domain-containing protein [Gemmatimonadaceae bacterium]|nr:GAF domain-containing protein [Gemmatimonadaceae bacterium]